MANLQEITFNTRLAAFQCSFAVLFRGEEMTSSILRYFASGKFRDEDSADWEINRPLFSFLAKGIVDKAAELDAKLVPLLSVPLDKNDPLVVAILRAGAFEILYRENTPKSVAVAEYVKLSDSFLPAQKVRLVNAVLDKVGG